jgi:rhamnose transport system ATP-binding protein
MLQLREISKSFGGTRALKNVSLEIQAGECVGLIGENGAGKSTLIKILAGVHQPDRGAITWQEAACRFANPRAALIAGIATIHQELACFEKLTVAENLMLGEPWPRQAWGGTNWPKLNLEARRQLEAFGLEILPETFFQKLSPAQRQEVAMARALARNARLLILDEPTASLTEPEVERLFLHLRNLGSKGISLLYVSHRLDEILQLTDRVLVLRDGELVAGYATAESTVQRLVRDMVGRELGAVLPRDRRAPGAAVLELRNLTRAGLFQNVSLTVRRGEIVGLAGLVGAGRSELARAIFGLYSAQSGTMLLEGRPWSPRGPAEARAAGLVYIPEERKRQGFVLEHSVQSSISIGFAHLLSSLGLIRPARERAKVNGAISRFSVKTSDAEQPIGTLSGGNQQKALLARWLESDPKMIILDEPARGVDVGAKAEIHRLINELAAQGKAVLLISSDLPEVLALSDRVVVLHRGRSVAEFSAAEATQEKVLMAASGLASPED